MTSTTSMQRERHSGELEALAAAIALRALAPAVTATLSIVPGRLGGARPGADLPGAAAGP
jgi:hypothetical protein